MLNVKIDYLNTETEKRREIAELYLTEINNPYIRLPKSCETDGHVWHLFTVLTDYRDELQEHLKNNSIQTLIHYPVPPHKQKAYSELSQLKFPITEKIHNTTLSLPISPVMSVAETYLVIKACNSFKR